MQQWKRILNHLMRKKGGGMKEGIYVLPLDNLPDNATIFERWTVGAIYCWSRNCQCEGCLYTRIMESACKMKHSVIRLIKLHGKPTKRHLNRLRKWRGEQC